MTTTKDSDACKTTALPDKVSWLRERMSGLGSSDAAAVVGVSPFKSAFGLYAEKIGLSEPDAAESEAMEWGTRLEPVIATKYAEETGRTLLDPGRFTLIRSRAVPFMLATPDRHVLMPNPHGSVGMLEIKTAGAYKADEWAEEPPLYYQVQLQHQLAVSGAAWGSLAVLIGGQKFLWVDIPRNERFIALLIEQEGEFWARIEKQDPPKPDASSNALMVKLWQRDDGTSIELPDVALAWDITRAQAIEQIKGLEKVKDEAEALLKNAMRDASYGVLPGGAGRFSWKIQSRAAYTVEAGESRVLRRLKK